MEPMLYAMIAVLFFAFAALSACLGAVFAIIGLWLVRNKARRLLGVYVLGSGFLGAAAAILFGILQQWNSIGAFIMVKPLLGYSAWAAIGFGWSTAAAFAVGCFARRLFRGWSVT